MMIFYWSVEYLATLIETVMCCLFAKIFIGKKEDKDKNIRIFIYSLFASIWVMIVNKVDLFSFLNGISGVIMLWVVLFIVYKRRYSFLVLITLVYAVIVSAIDFVVAQIGGVALSVKTSYLLNEQSLERCACVLVSKLILCLFIYLVYKYVQNELDIPKKYVFFIGFITMALLVWDYYIVEKSAAIENTEIKILSVTFCIVSIVLIALILSLVFKLVENYKQKQDIALLELQNEMIVKSEKNTENVFNLWRSSIHDYKHKIYAMKHWLDEGKIEELKDFIEKESESLTHKVFYIKTGNDVVDAIVNTKQNIAEEKGIVFSVNISIPPLCKISDIDFVCILGNLIDNAIEACENQSEKHIEIVIKEVKKLLYIKIVNSYEGELTDDIVTTKEEKIMHGIGLKNVRNIVEKYDGTYEMIKDKEEFITNIMIVNK